MSVERINLILRGTGMAQREIDSALLPSIFDIPTRADGFGLIGPTGVGKTVAMARRLYCWVDRIVRGSYNPDCAMAPYNFARWINWPSTAEHIKSLTSYADSRSLEDLLEGMATCGELYLDDIGQERIRGEDDLSLGHLRVIIDTRYRYNRPVFWTSNLDAEGFKQVYGARTLSRLVEAWPPAKITGRDMRLKKASGA